MAYYASLRVFWDMQNIGKISDETIYDDIDKKLLQKVIKWVYIVNVFI